MTLPSLQLSYLAVPEPVTLQQVRKDVYMGSGRRQVDEVLLWQHQLDRLEKEVRRGFRYYMEPADLSYVFTVDHAFAPVEHKEVLGTHPATIFGVPVRVENPDGE